MKRSTIYLFPLLLCFIASCGKIKPDENECTISRPLADLSDAIGLVNTNASTFPNTDLIRLDNYSYTKNGITYTVDMQRQLSTSDMCSFLDSVPLHAATPRFILPVPASKLVAVCISNSLLKIRSDRKSIDNTTDIVWTWNTGLKGGTISAGKMVIDYSDGKMVNNGKIDSVLALTPLSSGTLYFFSMWTWDDQGKVIQSSSANLPFMVENRLYSFSSLTFLAQNVFVGGTNHFATWQLQSAKDPATGASLVGTGAPALLSFTDVPCVTGTPEHVTYSDGAGVSMIEYDGKYITIYGSSTFKDKLELLYVCPAVLKVKTTLKDKPVVLTYER